MSVANKNHKPKGKKRIMTKMIGTKNECNTNKQYVKLKSILINQE